MQVFDIACIGTSLTNGSGTGWDGSSAVNGGQWQPLLRRRLQAGKSSLVRVYNFGFPGKNSAYGVQHAWKVAHLKPKVVLIEFSMNDSPGVQNISLSQSQANVETIISTIRAQSPDTQFILMTMNPAVGTSSAVQARANLPAYYQLYRDMVVADPDLMLVDNNLSWGGAGLSEIPDGIHPLLEEVEARLVPDIVSVVGALIP